MSEIGITQLEADLMKKCKELEEENKTLKECNKRQSEVINNVFIPQKERLEEENRTLKDNVEFLHSCLDDRDKSISIMQEENDKLKIHIEAKDKAYMDLLADYNYLKARIKKTERAFIKYKEKLEKLEVDLDMVVMNR